MTIPETMKAAVLRDVEKGLEVNEIRTPTPRRARYSSKSLPAVFAILTYT